MLFKDSGDGWVDARKQVQAGFAVRRIAWASCSGLCYQRYTVAMGLAARCLASVIGALVFTDIRKVIDRTWAIAVIMLLPILSRVLAGMWPLIANID